MLYSDIEGYMNKARVAEAVRGFSPSKDTARIRGTPTLFSRDRGMLTRSTGIV